MPPWQQTDGDQAAPLWNTAPEAAGCKCLRQP
jgi:hypothetical protein